MKRVGFLIIFLGLCLSSFANEDTLKNLKAKTLQFYQEKKYDKAMELAQESLKIAESKFGKESAEVANCLGDLSVIYQRQNNLQKSQELWQKAKAIREKLGIKGIPWGGLENEQMFLDSMRTRREMGPGEQTMPILLNQVK